MVRLPFRPCFFLPRMVHFNYTDRQEEGAAMRQKQLQLLITFPTTTAAMALEAAAREEGFPGRLIPLPTLLSAGCGLAWMAPPDLAEQARELLARWGLHYEAIHQMTL